MMQGTQYTAAPSDAEAIPSSVPEHGKLLRRLAVFSHSSGIRFKWEY